ncbi:hypothetical protein LY90DRAFT_503074 [Neocallimastix californiae]|uniref:Uncharacterized protein n=1 Tax=Neocallimastix californiae TaxID=1754190 RepID=A0A1Y2EQG9_9FUNG|nr:hypothetical protein LY90DRAFT_503074 [Neocallimastix californiae]|eukprot:ORY73534.1 hypothetical protein LY90DRAFT_503074 [Neocallimastix californiae]
MAYSYYQTAARLGFGIPNENEILNLNIKKDYRYKKFDITENTENEKFNLNHSTSYKNNGNSSVEHYNKISQERFNDKNLRYFTENSYYNSINPINNYPITESKAKNVINNDYYNYLLSNQYRSNNYDNNNNKGTLSEKNYNTNDLQKRIKSLNIEDKDETVKTDNIETNIDRLHHIDIEKRRLYDNYINGNNEKENDHSYCSINTNIRSRDYSPINSLISDLLGGLNVELENEDISNTDETTTSNNKELRVDRNKTISNMLKEFSKTNNENQQLKLEMQIQERKISNLEKDLKLYKSENINLKNQLEEKEKLSITVLKDKKQKTY